MGRGATRRGNFVKVAGAENQAEAEFLQGLLREEGALIAAPSARLRRSRLPGGWHCATCSSRNPKCGSRAMCCCRRTADHSCRIRRWSPRRSGCLRALSSPWRSRRSSSGSAPRSSYRRRRCTGYSAADRAPRDAKQPKELAVSTIDASASSNGRGSDAWWRSWTHFSIDRRSPGYCRVTFDHPPINAITATTVAELAELVGLIEEDQDLNVVVFDSA